MGCTAAWAEDESVGDESVARSEHRVIPGAAVTQVSNSYTIPVGGTLTDVTMQCPPGSVIVGGGYSSAAETRVFSSGPDGNGWTVSIQNLGGTSNRLDLVTQCLSGTNATSGLVGPTLMIVPKNGTGCAQASCPSGSLLTAGGYAGPSSFRASSNQLTSSGTWQVCGWNENPGESAWVSVYPLCLSGVSGAVTRQFKQGPNLAPGTSNGVNSEPCSSGLLLGSGGFQVTNRSVYTRGSTRSFLYPSRWQNTFVNLSSVTQATNVSTACLDLWQ
jgi:hypothetical protein